MKFNEKDIKTPLRLNEFNRWPYVAIQYGKLNTYEQQMRICYIDPMATLDEPDVTVWLVNKTTFLILKHF